MMPISRQITFTEIDCFFNMDGMPEQLRPHYSHTGRPSIDPELIVRMLVTGYVMCIRSERRLCQEVHLNLAYRWFCGPGQMTMYRTILFFILSMHRRRAFSETDAGLESLHAGHNETMYQETATCGTQTKATRS